MSFGGTYDPQKHDLIVGGVPIIGFADGTFIKASYNNDLWMLKTGADGFSTRVRNSDESGKFEMTLLASSPSNDYLAILAQADRAAGTGIVPVLLKDRSGFGVAAAELAWIMKPADMERGKELPDTTWVFETPQLVIVQGGAIQTIPAPPTP